MLGDCLVRTLVTTLFGILVTALFGSWPLPCSETGDCPVHKSTISKGETLEIVYTVVVDPKYAAKNVSNADLTNVVVVVGEIEIEK